MRGASRSMPVTRRLLRSPDGPTLAWSQVGAGRDIVLLHGALVTLDDMALGLFASLGEHFRVTAFDRPGHGQSGRFGPTGTPWRQAEAIAGAVGRLGLERPIIVGHSFGGAVALAYALQFPAKTRGVIALAPIAYPELRLEHLLFMPRGLPGAGAVLNAILSASVDPALLPLLWRAMFLPQAMPPAYAERFPFADAAGAPRLQAEGEDAGWLNAGLIRSAANYPTCQTPIRIFGGDRDLVVNTALHGRLLAAQLPNGRFKSLEGLGHMVHHFAQAEILAAAQALAD